MKPLPTIAAASLAVVLTHDSLKARPYYAHANNAGLFSSDQVQALHGPAAVLSRDPGSGKFVLTMDWQHPTDLENFFDFPLTDEDVSVNADGDIQFTFESEDDAMFFRVDWE